VVTGIFTITGVVVTAAAALLATWMKYKADRRQELRKERRELYARFQHASAQIWEPRCFESFRKRTQHLRRTMPSGP